MTTVSCAAAGLPGCALRGTQTQPDKPAAAPGDAFTGALAVARAEGMPLLQAVRFANAAGALCCTTLGAQPALPTRKAVECLLGTR